MRNSTTKWFFVTICVQLAIIGIILFHFLELKPEIFGKAVVDAIPGHITPLNIVWEEIHVTPPWHGYYGNISNTTGYVNDTTFDTEIENLLIYTRNQCFYLNDTDLDQYIYITHSKIDINHLEPATPAELDTYLNITDSRFLASKAFNATHNFTLLKKTYELYTAFVKSAGNSTFPVGLMKYNNTFVYITNADYNRTGYDGRDVTYQALVPISDKIPAYYFITRRNKFCYGCSFQIRPGWNYVSLCDESFNTSIQDIFRLNATFFLVSEWDKSSGNVITFSSLANSTMNITKDKSQFVYLNGNKQEFTVGGYTIDQKDILLTRYWNSLSHNFELASRIDYSFQSIAGDYSFLQKFNNSAQKLRAYSVYSSENEFNETQAGEGVLVYYMPDSGNLHYDMSRMGT